jgi:hypothetical protein
MERVRGPADFGACDRDRQGWDLLAAYTRTVREAEATLSWSKCGPVMIPFDSSIQNHVLRRSYVRGCGLRTIEVVLVRSGLCRNVFHSLVYTGLA